LTRDFQVAMRRSEKFMWRPCK